MNPRQKAYVKSRSEQNTTKREWIVDTAETAADQKRVAAELKKLDEQYKKATNWASRSPKAR